MIIISIIRNYYWKGQKKYKTAKWKPLILSVTGFQSLKHVIQTLPWRVLITDTQRALIRRINVKALRRFLAIGFSQFSRMWKQIVGCSRFLDRKPWHWLALHDFVPDFCARSRAKLERPFAVRFNFHNDTLTVKEMEIYLSSRDRPSR